MVYNIHDMFRVVWICKNIAVIIIFLRGTDKVKKQFNANEKKT